MVTFKGQPFHPICRLVISFFLEPVSNTLGSPTQSQSTNFRKNKCHVTCHASIMESAMNRVHQCIVLDGPYLTATVSMNNFICNLPQQWQIFVSQFPLLSMNFNRLFPPPRPTLSAHTNQQGNPISIKTLRRLMSYIYGAPILDVSRSHTTTQHSR